MRLMEWRKKWQPYDMIPVRVRQEDKNLIIILMHSGDVVAKLPDTCTAVENNMATIGRGHFNA